MARSVGGGAESGACGPWEEAESDRPASSQPSLRSRPDHPSHVQARRMTNAEDSIYGDGGERTTLRLRRRSGGGYRATLALGVS
jgi:hypothetical protein